MKYLFLVFVLVGCGPKVAVECYKDGKLRSRMETSIIIMSTSDNGGYDKCEIKEIEK